MKIKAFSCCLFILLLCTHIVGAGPTATNSPAIPINEEEEWLGMYFKGEKLGFSYSKMKRLPDSIVLDNKVFFQFQVGGANQTTSFAQKSVLGLDLKPKSFSLVQEITGHRQQVEGKRKNGKLNLKVTSAGYEKKKSTAFPAGATLSSTFLANILAEGLEVGKRGSIPVFIESFQVMSELKYQIVREEVFPYQGEKVETFVVAYNLSGMDSTLWITREGVLMQEIMRQGFELKKEPEAIARRMGESNFTASNFITLSMVKLDKQLKDSEKIRHLQLRLSRVPSGQGIPEDHRQKLLKTEKLPDGSHAVTLRVSSEPKGGHKKETSIGAGDFLGDSASVQTHHPKIKKMSRRLVRGASDPLKAALRINRWVFSNMEKAMVDSTTALDALNEKRGECQSHTYLYTALARAAGIPTKIVNGLVYSPHYGGFLYHAWPEVFVGEWRALDPTFGQDEVDATHIKLTAGAEENPLQLMGFIGKLEIEILEQ